MENSNTTCFISLEKPLTVTFTVDDVERGYDWANHVSGKHPNDRTCDIYSVLKDFGNLCGVPRSLSDSDIFAKFQDNDFRARDENLEPENRTDPSANQCCDAVHKSQAEEQETQLTDNTDNAGGCLLPGTKERNRFAENRCSFEELATGPVRGDREEQNLILDVTSLNNSRSGNFIGTDNSSQTEISRHTNGTVLPFAEHFHTSGSRNDDSKLKNEKIQLDLGYFTEEGNEGGRDEEECSDGLTGASISRKLSANDDCCCDDVRPQHVAKSPSVQPRSGILKHSRTSFSFDVSSSASTLQKESNNCADCYHFLSNSPSARNVAFFEPPISVYKWRFAVDFDSCQAMEKVRAVTNHLCLPVHNNVNRKDEHIENCSLNVTDQWKKTSVSLSADTWEAETSRINPAIVYDNVNEFFNRIKQELFQLRKADERIASRLLVLYGEIKQFKYVHNCHLYREMMEAAIDNEYKKDELFRHHVDTIPERLCATFKHWGLTRINLQRRRFSIF